MHHGAEHILFSDQTAVEQGQTGNGHHQDQRRGDQHPAVIGGKLGILHGHIQLLQMLLHLGFSGRGGLGMSNGREAAAEKKE